MKYLQKQKNKIKYKIDLNKSTQKLAINRLVYIMIGTHNQSSFQFRGPTYRSKHSTKKVNTKTKIDNIEAVTFHVD